MNDFVKGSPLFAAAMRMYTALKNLPCICKREHMYSGVGVQMCGRCEAMSMWEEAHTGHSETKREFEAKQL